MSRLSRKTCIQLLQAGNPAHFWHHSITVFKQTVHVDAFRAVARGGGGQWAMPPPRIPLPPPPANFQNLSNIEEALEKMQCCFHIWPF